MLRRFAIVVVVLLAGLLIFYRSQNSSQPLRQVSTIRFGIPGSFPPYVYRLDDGDIFIVQHDSRNSKSRNYMARMDANGVSEWEKWFDGKTRQMVRAVIGTSGDAYVLCTSPGQAPDGSVATFSRDGKALSIKPIDKMFTGQDILIGKHGEIYAAGSLYHDGHCALPYLAKCNSCGRQVWHRELNPPRSGSLAEATCIDIDTQGNIYIGGYTGIDPAVKKSGFISKISPSGLFLWTRQFALCGAYVTDIKADLHGNVYVGGSTHFGRRNPGVATGAAGWLSDSIANIKYRFGNTRIGPGDAFLAKYNGKGDQLWQQGIGTSLRDSVRTLALDKQGDVYLVLSSFSGRMGNGPCESSILIKYSSDGERIWIQPLKLEKNDVPDQISVDNLGDIHIVGSKMHTGHIYKVFSVTLRK